MRRFTHLFHRNTRGPIIGHELDVHIVNRVHANTHTLGPTKVGRNIIQHPDDGDLVLLSRWDFLYRYVRRPHPGRRLKTLQYLNRAIVQFHRRFSAQTKGIDREEWVRIARALFGQSRHRNTKGRALWRNVFFHGPTPQQKQAGKSPRNSLNNLDHIDALFLEISIPYRRTAYATQRSWPCQDTDKSRTSPHIMGFRPIPPCSQAIFVAEGLGSFPVSVGVGYVYTRHAFLNRN